MDSFREQEDLRMKTDISVHLLFTKQRILSYISCITIKKNAGN